MEIDPDWSRIGCAIGSSGHIPILLTELVSKDEIARERAFMTLVHDLAWNENAYEATPYAICRVVRDLRKHRDSRSCFVVDTLTKAWER